MFQKPSVRHDLRAGPLSGSQGVWPGECEAKAFFDAITQASQRLQQLLARPDLGLFLGETTITIGEVPSALFYVPEPGKLVITRHALAAPDAAVHLRHGLELAWLCTVAPANPVVCGLLAARVAALYARPHSNHRDAADALRSNSAPEDEILLQLWARLAPHQPEHVSVLPAAAVELVRAAWRLAAPVENLLATGGGNRLRAFAAPDVDAYRPKIPDSINLASCTASSISSRGYQAAEASRRRMLADIIAGGAGMARSREVEAMRSGVAERFGVSGLADVVLAPSGTDAALLTTMIYRARHPIKPITIILMGRAETGSGVPDAVVGCHPCDTSPLGEQVVVGAPIAGLDGPIELRCIALRNAAGVQRNAADIEADVAREVTAATDDGIAILHVMDTSKTGLQAPRPAFVHWLKQRYTDALEIVIDGSQGRVGPDQLRDYTMRGYSVIVTGSKFFSGPPFAGAVFVPRGCIQNNHAMFNLPGYSCAIDWHSSIDSFIPSVNVGLILRWAAALAEMQAFQKVSAHRAQQLFAHFAGCAIQELHARAHLIPFASAAPMRPAPGQWDCPQTIFAFAVRDPRDPRRVLDAPALRAVQKLLARDLSGELESDIAASRCHVGQPVMVAESAENKTWALRLAASARLVSDRSESPREAPDSGIGATLAKLDLVLKKLPLVL